MSSEIIGSVFRIYMVMRHIKLFEAFNSYELPNFRVELVKPGMSPGNYLFTCVDGSWNSFFGVFDLEGLKRLEDAMNTECVFSELMDAIVFGKMDNENSAFEAHTTIIVSKINPQERWINLHYRDFDIPFFSQNTVSNVSNPPPGLVLGEKGIWEEHIVHGHSVTTSESPLKQSPDREKIQNYPIIINELHYVDHHWSDHQKTKDYEKAFDENVGFRNRPLEEGDYGMKEIEPYMEGIIDAGVPKGFLKTLKQIEGKEVSQPPAPPQKTKEEKEFESIFYPLIDELGRMIYLDRYRPDDPNEWGDPGSRKRIGTIKEMKRKMEEATRPLLAKIESILSTYKDKLPQEYLDQKTEEYEMFKKSLFI